MRQTATFCDTPAVLPVAAGLQACRSYGQAWRPVPTIRPWRQVSEPAGFAHRFGDLCPLEAGAPAPLPITYLGRPPNATQSGAFFPSQRQTG